MLGLPETLTSQHFQVHYAGQVLPPGVSVIHQDAADLAGNLEQAYATMIGDWGYPAPLDDGDGKIDVFVVDLSVQGFLGLAWADNPSANQSSGYLYIDDNSVHDLRVAAHELFHLIQSSLWVPMDSYVKEASAEWAAFRALGFPLTVDMGEEDPVPLADTVGAPDMSVTCSGGACGLNPYDNNGYSRWNFFEYLSERFGGSAVYDLFQKAKTLNDTSLTGSDLLVAMLQDKAATLGDIFGDFTVANLSGGYTASGLKATLPAVYRLVPTGSATGGLGTQSIAVNHLAARYLAFQRGPARASGPLCGHALDHRHGPARPRRAPDVPLDGGRQPAAAARSERLDGVDQRPVGHVRVEGRRAPFAPEPDRERRRRGVQGHRIARGRQEHVRHVDAAARGYLHRPDDPGARGRRAAVDLGLRPGNAPGFRRSAWSGSSSSRAGWAACRPTSAGSRSARARSARATTTFASRSRRTPCARWQRAGASR